MTDNKLEQLLREAYAPQEPPEELNQSICRKNSSRKARKKSLTGLCICLAICIAAVSAVSLIRPERQISDTNSDTAAMAEEVTEEYTAADECLDYGTELRSLAGLEENAELKILSDTEYFYSVECDGHYYTLDKLNDRLARLGYYIGAVFNEATEFYFNQNNELIVLENGREKNYGCWTE